MIRSGENEDEVPMHRIRKSFVTLMMTLAAGGACFQFGGCDVLGLAAAAITSINPCGSLLNCDQREYEFLTSGISGPGVRPEIDPFCTFPPFCSLSPLQDPIFGGLSPTGP
jgi:hypothetical protein